MHQEAQGAIAHDLRGRSPAPGTEAENQLATLRLSLLHRTCDFRCTRSERVARFLQEQAVRWMEQRYCGVFVLPDPNDRTGVWGYYTLSQYLLTRDEMTRRDRQRQLIRNVPLVLIGFMGKHDGTPKGLGAALLVDAARRAYQNLDVPARGIALEPEGGRENYKLWSWYEGAGFVPAKTMPRLMYAPFENLIPELTASPSHSSVSAQ